MKLVFFLVGFLWMEQGFGLYTDFTNCLYNNNNNLDQFVVNIGFNVYVGSQAFTKLTLTKNGLIAFGDESARVPAINTLLPSPGMQLPTNTIPFPFIAPLWNSMQGTYGGVTCPDSKIDLQTMNQAAQAKGFAPMMPENVAVIRFLMTSSNNKPSVFFISFATMGQATMVFVQYFAVGNPSQTFAGYQYSMEGGHYAKFDPNTLGAQSIMAFMISTAECPPVGPTTSGNLPVKCPSALPTHFCVGRTGTFHWQIAVQNFIKVTCENNIATCRPYCPAGLVFNYLCNKCVYQTELGCTASVADRRSCGALSRDDCTKRGCCYDTERTTCFFKTITAVCSVSLDHRKQCDGPRKERQDCLDAGCCWDTTVTDATQCYKSQLLLDPTWYTECMRPLPPPPEVKSCNALTDQAELNRFCSLHGGKVYRGEVRFHFRIVNHANEFLQCDAFGMGFCKVCPAGLLFHHEKQTCVWPSQLTN